MEASDEKAVIIGPPAGWEELDTIAVMSNFDHKVEEDVAHLLRLGGCFSRHPGWNFNGVVWYADGQFHEQVWRYHQPVASYSAATLAELMELVNDEHGWA